MLASLHCTFEKLVSCKYVLGGLHWLHCPPSLGSLGRSGASRCSGYLGHAGGQQRVVPEHDPPQPITFQPWTRCKGGDRRRGCSSGRGCSFRRGRGQVSVWTHFGGGGGRWGGIWAREPKGVRWGVAPGFPSSFLARPMQVPSAIAPASADHEPDCRVRAEPTQATKFSGTGEHWRRWRTEPGERGGGLPAYGHITTSTICPALESAGGIEMEAGHALTDDVCKMITVPLHWRHPPCRTEGHFPLF